jgi:UDP-2-acetamido-2,6-beta-L-arabino-hexul-4-ose reductase
MKVLVTGAKGFVGRNLCMELGRVERVEVFAIDLDNTDDELQAALGQADVIFHLAGVNRPQNVDEFATGNAGFTERMCDSLRLLHRAPKIVISSSVQAEFDNPYGASKRGAEEAVACLCADTGAAGIIYRLKNLFGKWCRPNYNSVTATFCHNIAHDLPVQISDPLREVDLTYIDDVVAAFVAELEAPAEPGCRFADPLPSHVVTLGALAELIHSFRESRSTLLVPDLSDEFTKRLYGTYLSYLETDDFSYQLDIRTDHRGSLAEFVKSPPFGQIFVSRTKPGITRGDHFHHTKTEKFMVLEGDAIIRFRQIQGDVVIEYRVSGTDYRVVDIPTGYAHSIENVGEAELVTLFWACEIFDPARPGTYPAQVDLPKGSAA